MIEDTLMRRNYGGSDFKGCLTRIVYSVER